MPLDQDALRNLRIERTEVPKGTGASTRRALWIAGGACVLAAGLLVSWIWWRGSHAQEVQTATAMAAEGGSSAAVLDASGYVVARRLSTVSSKVTGKIAEVLIEEGATVTEGQVLARLDDSTAHAQYELAQLQLQASRKALAEVQVRLAEANRTLARTRTLRQQNLVSETALDTAQSEVAALTARLEALGGEADVTASNLRVRARDLDDLVIRAPFAGVVISKDAQPGEMVSPISAGGGYTRTGIATIVDMDSREIEVDVNEAFINRVQAGQRVEAVLDAYPGWVLPAHVIKIVPTADRQKATVRVRIGFVQLDPRILPDMGVKVHFLEEGTAPAAGGPKALATIPVSAVTSVDGRSYVWVVRDGRVERRAIRTGSERDGQVEVLAGVRAGEVVVAPAMLGLTDGARVKVKTS